MASITSRIASVPRLALRRPEAATALGISPGLFDSWVNEGRMPKGRKIGGVVLWDVDAIRGAWQALSEDEAPVEDEGENPFDHQVV